MGDKVNVSGVLAQLGEKGKLSKGDKRWVTQKLTEQRRHELNISLIQACGENPDLPLLLMFLGGTAGVAAADLLKKLSNRDENGNIIEDTANRYFDFLESLQSPVGLYITKGTVDFLTGDGDSDFGKPGNWVEFATGSLKSLSQGVQIFAGSLLVMRAIFGGGTKDGGLASLAGLVA